MTGEKPLVLGIVGPTASGKTAWSLAVADRLPVEIVCMDSMQVYQGLDIGTAKPTPEERARVPHHMLDVRPPDAAYSVAEYRQEAAEAIRGIVSRGALPLLVGGTGLYLRALSLPLDLGGTQKDEGIRQRYQALLEDQGVQAVHHRLAQVDPISAARLHPNDSRRVIRALEVYELTGRPFSAQRMPGGQEGPYRIQLFARDWPRALLYQRIEGRVDQMLSLGLLAEIRQLLDRGVDESHQSMQGLGYKELIPHLRGQAPLADCVALLKQRTRNYAKRQLTWFRRDSQIRWLPHDMTPQAFAALMEQEVASK